MPWKRLKTLRLNSIFALFRYGLLGIGFAFPWNSMAAALDQPLVAPLPARAGTRVINTDWLVNREKSNDESLTVEWLDSTHLIYTVPPIAVEKFSKIEVLDVQTQARTSLGEGLMPKPSPNGQWVAFIRMMGNTKQLWFMKSDGRGEKQLTRLSGGLTGYPEFSYGFAWAPDSKRLALYRQPSVPRGALSKVRDAKRITATSQTSAVNIEHSQPGSPPHTVIEVIDVMRAQTKQILSVDESLRNLSWFPNGRELLFMTERIGSNYNKENDESRVQSVRVSDGTVHTLAAFEGLQQWLRPVSSPDGRQVAFIHDADYPLFSLMPNVGLVSKDPMSANLVPPITRLTHELKLFSPQWSRDGRKIYVLRDYGAYAQVYAIDVKTGEPTQITQAPLSVRSYTLSPNGKQLAWIGQDAHATRKVRLSASDGQNVRDLIAMPGTPTDIALDEVREIAWSIPHYPVQMRGLLFLPLHYQEGIRYPLVVDIHGGDYGSSLSFEGSVLMDTPLEWQMWAAKEYAVFVPELRSSMSFGSLAITRDLLTKHDLRNRDVEDVVAGVDALIARGIVDSNRTAVIGHSAGALRANWLTVSTHRFRTVVSNEGWADEWLESGVHPMKRVEWMYGGSPAQFPENYKKNSPIFHAQGASTPTLFLMGNPLQGGVDSYDTVRWLYSALKAQGVETQYVQYPDEGHVLERPANRRDALERVTRWIDGHVGAK